MALEKPYRVKMDPNNVHINLLLYGPQGVGKTTLAASAQEHPALGPVLLVNFEGGTLSLVSRGDIDAIDINSIDEVDELFWLLRNKTDGFEQYKTIILDSGSEMQTLALEDTARAEIEKARRQGKNTERTIDDMELQTYGKSGAQLSRIFRWFRDLPINTIVTALPKFTYPAGANTKTGTPSLVVPFFTDKLGTQIMGYMDFVWYMGDDGSGRKYILTRDQGPYRAKTRGFNFANALGAIHSDPWLPNIYEMLLESEKGQARAEAVTNEEPVSVSNLFQTEGDE